VHLLNRENRVRTAGNNASSLASIQKPRLGRTRARFNCLLPDAARSIQMPLAKASASRRYFTAKRVARKVCVRLFIRSRRLPQAGNELSRIASYYPVKRVLHADRNLLIITTCYTKMRKKSNVDGATTGGRESSLLYRVLKVTEMLISNINNL